MTDLPVLFLDVDGVLNDAWTRPDPNLGFTGMSPALVRRLNQVYERSPFAIVLSSTWRLLYDREFMLEYLQRQGLRDDIELIGYTPAIDMAARWKEIEDWLTSNPARRFAIVDDDCRAGRGRLAQFFVETNPSVGITAEVVARLVALLEVTQ